MAIPDLRLADINRRLDHLASRGVAPNEPDYQRLLGEADRLLDQLEAVRRSGDRRRAKMTDHWRHAPARPV